VSPWRPPSRRSPQWWDSEPRPLWPPRRTLLIPHHVLDQRGRSDDHRAHHHRQPRFRGLRRERQRHHRSRPGHRRPWPPRRFLDGDGLVDALPHRRRDASGNDPELGRHLHAGPADRHHRCPGAGARPVRHARRAAHGLHRHRGRLQLGHLEPHPVDRTAGGRRRRYLHRNGDTFGGMTGCPWLWRSRRFSPRSPSRPLPVRPRRGRTSRSASGCWKRPSRDATIRGRTCISSTTSSRDRPSPGASRCSTRPTRPASSRSTPPRRTSTTTSSSSARIARPTSSPRGPGSRSTR